MLGLMLNDVNKWSLRSVHRNSHSIWRPHWCPVLTGLQIFVVFAIDITLPLRLIQFPINHFCNYTMIITMVTMKIMIIMIITPITGKYNSNNNKSYRLSYQNARGLMIVVAYLGYKNVSFWFLIILQQIVWLQTWRNKHFLFLLWVFLAKNIVKS